MLKKLSTFIDFGNTGTNSSYRTEAMGKSSDGFDFLHLINAWQEIAGNKLSEHTIPLKNQNGTLVVLSNHSAFASEMKFMEMPLKKKIFQKFPNLEKSIKTITFIVDSTHFNKQVEMFSPKKLQEKMELSLPHPQSPEAKKLQKEADELFFDIEDLELKKSFCSIYIQNKFNSK
jgi:hypothetical protein